MGRRRFAVAFVAAVIAVSSLIGVEASEAVVPAGNGKIAFWSTRNGVAEIFTMNTDGTTQTSLGSGYVPAWSPDGAKIAFEDNGDLYVMNADGSGRTALTTTGGGAHDPTWSPDGTKIAYDGDDGGGGEAIFVMDAGGANTVQLAGDGLADDSPDWSPDGTKIAFVSSGQSNEIAVMNAAGTGALQITHLMDTGLAEGGTSPHWSPDGTKIGYSASVDGEQQLHVMNPDGSGDVSVSRLKDFQGTWSPDGTRGVFASTRAGNSQIYTTTTDFGVQTQLTTDGSNLGPAWQPVLSPCAEQRSGTWIGSWNQPADHVSGTSESVTTNANDAITGSLTFLTGSNLLLPGTSINGTISCFRMTATAGVLSLTGVLLYDGREMGGTYSYPPQGPYPGGSGYWHSSWVPSPVSGTGKTLTTDTGATGATSTDPLQTLVTSPTSGALSIQQSSTTAPGYISGYQLSDQLVRIQAPSATPTAPLKFTFTLDQTALAGRAPGLVAVFRNGVLVPECAVANSMVANPDPCVASRLVLAGSGDVRITVLTSAASVWEFGLPVLGKAVSVGSGSVVEGDTGAARTVSFSVTLTEPSNAEVKVGYRINVVGGSGAASSPADFASTSGYVTFKPSVSTGLTPTSASVSASISPDVLASEGDETFEVVLSDPTGGYKLGVATGTGTILDDDPGTGLRVAVGDGAIWEGNAAASPTATNTGSVQVTLSSPATSTVSVLVTVGNGSASAGSDFTKTFTKTVTFKPGQYKATIAIPIKPDTLSESDETVTIGLSNATGSLTIGRATGHLTILNDD